MHGLAFKTFWCVKTNSFLSPGFAETLYGRKRWFLTPPDVKPDFHPNKTTLQWFVHDYPKQKNEIDILECTLRPGEVFISF
jgi:hypothetical protein